MQYLIKLLITGIFIYSSSLFAIEPVQVVTANWKPYNYLENGVLVGSGTAIVKAVFKEAQVPYKINVYPWARTYKMAEKTPNTLIYTLVRVPMREKMFKWVRPIGMSDKVYFYQLANNTDAPQIKHINDLKKYRFGVVRNSINHQYLKQLGFKEGENLQPLRHQSLNLKQLMKGHLTFSVFAEDNLHQELSSLNIPKKKLRPALFLQDIRFYMSFNKNTPDSLVQKLQAAYDRLQQQGKIAIFK